MLRVAGKSQLVVAAALMSLVGCGILLSARSLGLLFAGAALIGLSYGPIFPTTLAIAGDRYSKRAGTVFGLLFSIALIGGMMLPWAVGQVSQNAGRSRWHDRAVACSRRHCCLIRDGDVARP